MTQRKTDSTTAAGRVQAALNGEKPTDRVVVIPARTGAPDTSHIKR